MCAALFAKGCLFVFFPFCTEARGRGQELSLGSPAKEDAPKDGSKRTGSGAWMAESIPVATREQPSADSLT